MPLLSLLVFCALSFAPAAQADDVLDEVLAVMAKYGGLDQAILDAKEMVSCLVANNGNANACFNIPTEAEKQAGKAAVKFMPDDPKIQALVKLVSAVQKEQWLKVVEIAGLDILAQFICENTARAGGPVGSWFCSGPFKEVVAGYAKPIAEEAFRLLNGGSLNLGKLFELVALLADLDLACKLIPDEIPGVGEACSVLGKIIAEIGGVFVDAAKYGAKIVVSTADDVEDIIFGSDAHMPYDKYYGLYWLPWLHKSVNLCITNNCAGTGQLNERIWNDCVDYFDAHNQYRDTAKKTCDDMRDKRYLKTYDLLSKAILNGARAYVDAIRAGAKAWAITEYGKNNDAGIRSNFLTLCETELEQGYPLSSGNAAMCNAYKQPGTGFNKVLYDALYDNCVAEVAAQQVSPTAWRNACKKAEPDFVLMLKGEQQALQSNIAALVSESCAPPQGWSSQQGLRFQCQTYSGYDHCLKVMVVGANSICSVDRNKADAARAKEILGYLGTTRCSLSGNEVLCRRPWKHTQCNQLIKVTPAVQLSKTTLSCKEDSSDYYKIAFANEALIKELNHPIARSGQGPQCSWIEDKAKISCLRVDVLEKQLAAKPELQRPECKYDPNYNGSDVSCYLKPYNKNAAPQDNAASESSTIVPAVQQPVGAQAPPNPCRMSVSYYVPQAPIVSAIASRILVNDQFQIQCSFKKVTREVEWPQCDDTARTSMQILDVSKRSGSRYSGVVAIDGNTVGVSSSPEDGSDFASTKTWKFENPGAHDVSCQVDNAFYHVTEGAPTFLNAGVSFDVSARTDGLTYRRFEPESASTLTVRPLSSEAAPIARDGRFRVLQNEEPTAARSESTSVRRSQGDIKTTLQCTHTSAGDQKRGQRNFEVWAENTSAKVLDSGRTIAWRVYGSGALDKWPLEGTYSLPAALPIGAKTMVAADKLFGSISSCEAWAQ
jgi:hypothetical protein